MSYFESPGSKNDLELLYLQILTCEYSCTHKSSSFCFLFIMNHHGSWDHYQQILLLDAIKLYVSDFLHSRSVVLFFS